MESENQKSGDERMSNWDMQSLKRRLKDRKFQVWLIALAAFLIFLPKVWPHIYAVLPIHEPLEVPGVAAEGYVVEPRNLIG